MKKLSEMFKAVNSQSWQTTGHDVQYAFLREDSQLTIYFEGSSSKIDWTRNFMFSKRPYKDMADPYRVHRGFLAAWKEVEDTILAQIADTSVNSIRIVGYSHGAALAAFCHECCWFHRPDIRNNIIGVGFEAPRIYAGFRVKASLLERWNNFFVIRNNTDMVTHLPPWIFGYCHVGNIIHVGRGKRYGPIDSHRPEFVSESLNQLLI